MCGCTRGVTVFGVLVVGLLGSIVAGAQPVKVGKEFPNFEGRDLLTGKRISLKQFRGKVVLVDFWASWCPPCRKEIPNIKKAYEKYHKKGFEIISISLDRSKADCERYIKRREMNWYQICDGRGWEAKLAVRFGVRAIPQMYLIGRDGKVVSTSARGEALGKAVERALAQSYDGSAYTEETVDDDIERQAQAALAKADKLQAEGRHAEALKLYDEIGLKYLGRPTAKQANQRARLIRENPDLAKELEQAKRQPKKLDAEAARRVQRWTKLASAFARQKNYKLARKYYQKIIDEHPGTKEAQAAEKALKKLPK